MISAKFLSTVIAVVALQALLVAGKAPDWVPQEMLDMIQDDKARCMAEHGTTEELIEMVNDGNIPDDTKITCYMYCLLEAFSVADEDGNIDADVLMSVLPERFLKQAQEVLGVCGSVSGKDACDKVAAMARCVQSQVPELWFIV